MKKITHPFIYAVLCCLVVACSSPEQNIEQRIADAKANLYSNDNTTFNKDAAAELTNAYLDYAEQYPDEDRAPEYLFLAAETYRSMREFPKAIDTYQKLYNDYKSYNKAPYSLFLIAFIYENDLKQLGKAEKYYREYLATYPNHEFSDDAEIALQNLGKSPEELLREIQERRAKGDTLPPLKKANMQTQHK